MSELFLLDIFIKYIKNIEINKNYIIQKLISILNSQFIHSLNIEHVNYLKILIKKILQIKSITESECKLLRNYISRLHLN